MLCSRKFPSCNFYFDVPAVCGGSFGQIFSEFQDFSFPSEEKCEEALLKNLDFREVKVRCKLLSLEIVFYLYHKRPVCSVSYI